MTGILIKTLIIVHEVMVFVRERWLYRTLLLLYCVMELMLL